MTSAHKSHQDVLGCPPASPCVSHVETPSTRTDTTAEIGRAVYGLVVHGLDDVQELQTPSRPQVSAEGIGIAEIRIGQLDVPPPAVHPLDGERAVVALVDGRFLEMGRQAGEATFYGPPLENDLLAHPYLGPVAVTFNRWAGRESYHAGAFVSGGRAWIVMGERTAGKSTLLAGLAGENVPILADDVVITDGEYVYAGPRSLDLREPVPDLQLGVQRARLDTRHRVLLPHVPLRVELGGWIFLHWEETTSVRPVGARELLSRVAGRRSARSLPSDPTCLLALATVPAWDHGRPREWASLSQSVDLLMQTTESAAAKASVR